MLSSMLNSLWGNRMTPGVENRGSLISVQLALKVKLGEKSASSKPTTEFAQPRLSMSRVNDGGRPQRGGANLGVFVLIRPVMRMPG